MSSNINSQDARTFLTRHFDPASAAVEPIGEGAWSRCFGFRCGDRHLVVRFGRHIDDFQKDQLAYAYHAPDLPIPEVIAIGRAFDGYYAISTRVHGVPLENLTTLRWLSVIPSLVAALEAMRTADISTTAGSGGWDSTATAPHAGWAGYLLAVGDDTPHRRTHGWRAKLATSPIGAAAFRWGFDLLQRLAHTYAPRCLIHGDLINRNVLVDAAQITGIFDWGCSSYGDHLYDLAWFEFWAPWHPALDIPALRSALEHRWREVGYTPRHQDERLKACYLHIGLDHLAYNAYLEDWPALTATAERMRTIVAGQ